MNYTKVISFVLDHLKVFLTGQGATGKIRAGAG